MAMVDRLLREQATVAPTTQLDVIVTVEPGCGNDRLAAAGLVVLHRIERINAVSGTLQAGKLDSLAALPGVVRIEADAPMRAF
jgi:hypothetical protein